MYQVILQNDEKRNKSYYYSYVESDDKTLGNISVSTLPDFQDINMARACYFDGLKWIYDADKYEDIIKAIEEEKRIAEEEAERLASIPDNETLNEMVLANMESINELMYVIDTAVKPLMKLASLLKSDDEEE